MPELSRRIADVFSDRSNNRAFHLKSSDEECRYRLPKHDDEIKVAYISSSFCNHTPGFLVQGIFSLYNRDRFQVMCYALNSSDGSDKCKDMEARLC